MFDQLRNKLKNKSGQSGSSNGLTVLVVDDGPVDLKVAVSALEKAGYNVISEVNGEEGLATAREKHPDLILLDCDMPVMTGPQMCKKLKEDETISDIPVIFLTSVDTPTNIINCFELDVENYLSKPISSKLLAAQVKIVLDEIHS